MLAPILAAYRTTGDPKFKEQIVNLYRDDVKHFALAHRNALLPADEAEQCATVGLLKAIDGYDPSKGSFGFFAYVHMRGAVQSERNKELRRTGLAAGLSHACPNPVPMDGLVEDDHDPAKEVADAELSEIVWKRIRARLPKTVHRVAELWFRRGMDRSAISQETGLSGATVTSAIRKVQRAAQEVAAELRVFYAEGAGH